ncbi:ABC transporter substrate-binding protein [Phreatobacter stygius]|uniref:ABC transporter substrate-binding protein n=1 Tax=Phreatobacter stygius TaxID=1940610 RepID=UPI001476D30E|nr:ABC transporter substrate-binding protein [Phreatobacter stygius]
MNVLRLGFPPAWRTLVRLLAAGLLLALALPPEARARAMPELPIKVTDLAGREVVLPRAARRLVLGAWVSLDALSLLHPDPVGLVVGWAEGGANTIQPAIVRARYPAVDRIPAIGRGTLDSLSAETIIALKPDLVVLSSFDLQRYGSGPASYPPAFGQLEAAGIAIVVVDFFLQPLENTEPSLRLLGKLIGREAQAEAYIGFYRGRLDRIAGRLADAKQPRPAVFFHAFADRPDCCFTAGPGTVDGMIRAAGGVNIGSERLTGPIGQVSLEFLISRNPDVYVASAIGAPAGLAFGPGIAAERAASGFAALIRRPDLAALGAMAGGRAHGLWHLFVHTPVHVVAIERLAKWLHPRLFADLDPDATLYEINTRYLAAPLDGSFWTDGPPAAPAPTRR